jgi:hypothetical protein
MNDVLVVTVPIAGAYASMNSLDRIDRRKSPAYLDLFRDTRELTRRAIEEQGWSTREYFVETQVVRYTRDLRAFNGDAGNIGKAELDALSPSTAQQERRDGCKPFAGVWVNDRLARPYRADIEYDPDGIERVVIIMRRRFPDPAGTRKRSPGKAVIQESAEMVAPLTVTDAVVRDVVEYVRTLEEIPSGTTVSFAERDRILAAALPRKTNARDGK